MADESLTIKVENSFLSAESCDSDAISFDLPTIKVKEESELISEEDGANNAGLSLQSTFKHENESESSIMAATLSNIEIGGSLLSTGNCAPIATPFDVPIFRVKVENELGSGEEGGAYLTGLSLQSALKGENENCDENTGVFDSSSVMADDPLRIKPEDIFSSTRNCASNAAAFDLPVVKVKVENELISGEEGEGNLSGGAVRHPYYAENGVTGHYDVLEFVEPTSNNGNLCLSNKIHDEVPPDEKNLISGTMTFPVKVSADLETGEISSSQNAPSVKIPQKKGRARRRKKTLTGRSEAEKKRNYRRSVNLASYSNRLPKKVRFTKKATTDLLEVKAETNCNAVRTYFKSGEFSNFSNMFFDETRRKNMVQNIQPIEENILPGTVSPSLKSNAAFEIDKVPPFHSVYLSENLLKKGTSRRRKRTLTGKKEAKRQREAKRKWRNAVRKNSKSCNTEPC